MSELASLARLDWVLAWRRGVIGAAAAVVVIYVTLLRVMPEAAASVVLPYLVFSDPAALGFFFVGGIVLADRSEGTSAAVSVTPASPLAVLVGRVGVLAAVGTVGGLAVAAGSGLGERWFTFVPGVLLTALLYTSFGYAVALRARSVNDYFARATLWSIPLFVPLVAVGLGTSEWILALWPTTAALLLLGGGADGLVAAVALSVLAVGAAGVGRWALAELIAARREGRT